MDGTTTVSMEIRQMRDLFVEALGAPGGIVLYQLLDATQYTVYLSLGAFAGGAVRVGATAASGRKVPPPADRVCCGERCVGTWARG